MSRTVDPEIRRWVEEAQGAPPPRCFHPPSTWAVDPLTGRFDDGREAWCLVTRKGQTQFWWRCKECGENRPATKWERQIHAERFANAQVERDYACRICAGVGCELCIRTDGRCERCGSPEQVEEHHWAPRHLFSDADSWPLSYLCRKCHVYWHRLVTPNMGRRTAK
jgi:hypothetical protein